MNYDTEFSVPERKRHRRDHPDHSTASGIRHQRQQKYQDPASAVGPGGTTRIIPPGKPWRKDPRSGTMLLSSSHGRQYKKDRVGARNIKEKNMTDMMDTSAFAGTVEAAPMGTEVNTQQGYDDDNDGGDGWVDWELVSDSWDTYAWYPGCYSARMEALDVMASSPKLPGTIDLVKRISRDTSLDCTRFLRFLSEARVYTSTFGKTMGITSAKQIWPRESSASVFVETSPIFGIGDRLAPEFAKYLHGGEKLDKLVRMLLRTFYSLTLPHNSVRLRFFRLENVQLPDFFDTILFSNRSVKCRRDRLFSDDQDVTLGRKHQRLEYAQKMPCLRILQDDLLRCSTNTLNSIASSSSGRCFFLKMMAHTLEEICHRLFPGCWFATKISVTRHSNGDRGYFANDKTQEIHRDILLTCRLLGLSNLNRGGMHNWFIDHSELKKRSKVSYSFQPPWEVPPGPDEGHQRWEAKHRVPSVKWPRTWCELARWYDHVNQESDDYSWMHFHPGGLRKDPYETLFGPAFLESPTTVSASAKLYRMLIARCLEHIMDVKNGRFARTPTWSGRKLRSGNWGKAIIFRAMRHQIALDRAMLNHCWKVSRSKLEKLQRKNDPVLRNKDVYVSYLGRMSYDPITIVFAYLHGSGIGTPPKFYQKLWGDRTERRGVRKQVKQTKLAKGQVLLSTEKFSFCKTCQRRGHETGACPNLGMIVCRGCRQRGHLFEACHEPRDLHRSYYRDWEDVLARKGERVLRKSERRPKE